MALTYGNPTKWSIGARWQTTTQVTLDSSYPTGGYTINTSSLGLPCGLVDVIDANTGPDSGYTPAYNGTTGLLQMFDPVAAHTHVENTAGAYVQNATTGAATAAPGQEVPNATNLATVVVTVVATGR